MKNKSDSTFKSEKFAVEMVSAKLQVFDKAGNVVLELDKIFKKPFVFTPVDNMLLAWHIKGDYYVEPSRLKKFLARLNGRRFG